MNNVQDKKERKSVSLFTGAGGMDVGFSRAGFNVVWANDINADACETYKLNHSGTIECGDVRNFIKDLSSLKKVDLVFGGPPCQGFSVAGKMNPNDERSKLIFTFMDVVEKVKPKAFVLENVKALAVLDKWEPVRKGLFKRAQELGYSFTELVLLNATHYGVPQKRERMFFVGIKDATKINKSMTGFHEYLDKYKKTALPIKKLFRELGPAGTEKNQMVCKAKITLARAPVLRKSAYAGMIFNGAGRPIDAEGYSNTLPASMGGNRTPIIDENQIFNRGESWIENYHGMLLTGQKTKGITPPKYLRRITVEEAARIQTFPEDYKFAGRQNSIYSQIGNAVPCELAYVVGAALQDVLDSEGL
jgi:DNA (cytosine-5)-methyltransferase 1